jgi:hypothetical protein
MLQHRKGKLTIAKSKSSRLPHNEAVSPPLESILSKISRYDADPSDRNYKLAQKFDIRKINGGGGNLVAYGGRDCFS